MGRGLRIFGAKVLASDDAYSHANVHASAQENLEGPEHFVAVPR